MARFPSLLLGLVAIWLLAIWGCGSDNSDGQTDLTIDFWLFDANTRGSDAVDSTADSLERSDSGSDGADVKPGDTSADGDSGGGPDLLNQICVPGTNACQDLFTPGECNAIGDGWILLNKCSEGYTCHADKGSCAKKNCDPGKGECLDSHTIRKCKFDGSGYEEPSTCGESQFCSSGICISSNCLPRVMFLVDRSTSMESNWGSIQNSITAVVAANPGVEFGLTAFPSEDGFFAGCTMEPDAPHVPIQANADAALDAWFEDNGPAGATPLKTAMEWVTDNVTLIWGSEVKNAYLVLLSDGEDKCTCSQYENDADKRAECVSEMLLGITQELTQKGVKTFVIGYAYSGPDIELTTIAENGGTGIDTWIYAGDEASLTAAFGKVVDDIKWCL